MAEFPGFTLWTDAYLGDTVHLSTLEHGAYLLLLMAMWRNGGTLPNDDHKLARFSHLSAAQWARIKPTIMDFMTVDAGSISQSRLTRELMFVRQRSRQQSDNAKAKSLKTNNQTQAKPSFGTSQTPAPTLTLTPTKKEEDKGPSLRSGTKSNGTRLSEVWVLPKSYGDWALERGLPRERVLIEADKMKNWSINAGRTGVKVDWFAAWRNWVQKALDDLPRLPGRAPPAPKPNSLQAAIERRRERQNADAETGSLVGASVRLLRDHPGG